MFCECGVDLVLVPAGRIEALVGGVLTCRWSAVLIGDVLRDKYVFSSNEMQHKKPHALCLSSYSVVGNTHSAPL